MTRVTAGQRYKRQGEANNRETEEAGKKQRKKNRRNKYVSIIVRSPFDRDAHASTRYVDGAFRPKRVTTDGIFGSSK